MDKSENDTMISELQVYFITGFSLGNFGKIRYKLKYKSIGESSNGRTAAFEAVNLGPNPSSPALRQILKLKPTAGPGLQAILRDFKSSGFNRLFPIKP